MRHELDTHQFDFLDNVSDAFYGENFAEEINHYNEKEGIRFPNNARYLALGAGQAEAELAIATGVGIDMENVTLLDKKFSLRAKRKFKRINFPGQIIEEGALSYLQSQTTPSFHLISAIMMEYSIQSDEDEQTLIQGISHTLFPGGVALVQLAKHSDHYDQVFKSGGFSSLYRDGGAYLMRFSGLPADK